jgi:hypothetical protein
VQNRAVVVDNQGARCELIERVLQSLGIKSLVFAAAILGLRTDVPDSPTDARLRQRMTTYLDAHVQVPVPTSKTLQQPNVGTSAGLPKCQAPSVG